MLLWCCYMVVSLLFLWVGFATVYIGGYPLWLLLPAVAGCFLLNAIASWRIFLQPKEGCRNGITGCAMMLPLFAYTVPHTYGIPLAATLLVMYYTWVVMKRNPSPERMMRHTTSWRVKQASGFWALFVTFMLVALMLGSFNATKDIFVIGDAAALFWK